MQLGVYRHEKKFIIGHDKAARLQEELALLLETDPYSANGYYSVRSLYFDSINERDYYEKLAGDYLRRKIRLRVYTPEDKTAKLEIKEKRGDLQHKQSLIVDREQARLLCQGDYFFLGDMDSELARRLYLMMTLKSYRPAALIEYDRRAFVYQEFDTRITFDTAVKSSETEQDIFEKEPLYNSILADRVVLEVKYNGKLFKPISGVLKKYGITNTSYSKYSNGRRVIKGGEY